MTILQATLWIPLIFAFVDFISVDLLLSFDANLHNFSLSTLKSQIASASPKIYDLQTSLVEFWILSLIRFCIISAIFLAVAIKPRNSIERIKSISSIWLLIFSFFTALCSPIKLLPYSEIDGQLKQLQFWLLFGWNFFASSILFVLWLACFKRIKPPQNLYSNLDEEQPTSPAAPAPKQPFKWPPEKKLSGKSKNEKDSDNPKLSNRETVALVKRLLAYCGKQWAYFLTGFIFLILYSAARVFIPYYTGQVIGDIVLTHSYDDLLRSVLVMVLLTIVSAVCGSLRGSLLSYATALVNRDIRLDLFRSLINQEMGFFDETKTGELISRLTGDCTTMSDTVALNINVLLRNLLMSIGSFGVMFNLSWRLSLLSLIAMPLIAIIVRSWGLWYDKLYEEQQATLADSTEQAQEVFSSMRTVRSFAGEKFECARYWKNLNIMLHVSWKLSLVYLGDILMNEFFNLFLLVAVLWYGGHLVISGRMGGDKLISFLLYQVELSDNLLQISWVYSGLMQSVGASRKVFEYIGRQPKIPNDGTATLADCKGELEFKDVNFTYPTRSETQVLDTVNFKVLPGETVALVGPSGGGKSSCIALLEHFYEPSSGQVLLDGEHVGQFDHGFLHSSVALVGQEPVLFGTSIAENIAYGMEEAAVTREMIEEAARLANAHQFVSEMKDGFMTDVGEKGLQLSGGQKQRVAIARALIRRPKVLLLDEATSALDSDSEHLVQEAIYRNLAGHTVLLIAHRLSTVEKADRIIVINKGSVVQEGTHQQLLSQDGLYKNLVHRQLLGSGENAVPEDASANPSIGGAVSTAAIECPKLMQRHLSVPVGTPSVLPMMMKSSV